ncbi:hypothetical protein E4T42_09010 [Aureobasidium subglaciale]|nr:hypothetical protein E4T42_09010 [Aureobasidium subglaciale]
MPRRGEPTDTNFHLTVARRDIRSALESAVWIQRSNVEFPDQEAHMLRRVVNHINAGDMRIQKAETQITELEAIIDEEVMRTAGTIRVNGAVAPLYYNRSELLSTVLVAKVTERVRTTIFDEAVMTEIRNRIKAQINAALLEDLEEFQKQQTEALKQHLEGETTGQ